MTAVIKAVVVTPLLLHRAKINPHHYKAQEKVPLASQMLPFIKGKMVCFNPLFIHVFTLCRRVDQFYVYTMWCAYFI
jgi:hypothetical protein